MTDRYDTTGNLEAQAQPGSNGRGLANKLGVTDPDEMNAIELDLLLQLHDAIINEVTEDQQLHASDLCNWHRRWLGNVYDWAGRYRSVNMGKDGFPFATSGQIPRLMENLDREVLALQTPCAAMSADRLTEAIAIVHIEVILIHPFREGNGRLSRLLANIMALQAGWPNLDFSAWDRDQSGYFAAIRAGLDDSAPMQQLVRPVLRESSAVGGS